MQWVIERRYPRKADQAPYDQPERWEGDTLRGFADRLEDAAGMDRENTSVIVGDLVGELVMQSYLATDAVSALWDDEDDEDGRVISATVEWEV